MNIFFRSLVFVLFASACNSNGTRRDETLTTKGKETAFDSIRWQAKDGRDYPFRDAMLDDLIESGKLKSLNYDGILRLLVPPDRADSLYLFYTVDQTRIQNWPLHTRTMVVKFRADSSVLWVKVHQ